MARTKAGSGGVEFGRLVATPGVHGTAAGPGGVDRASSPDGDVSGCSRGTPRDRGRFISQTRRRPARPRRREIGSGGGGRWRRVLGVSGSPRDRAKAGSGGVECGRFVESGGGGCCGSGVKVAPRPSSRRRELTGRGRSRWRRVRHRTSSPDGRCAAGRRRRPGACRGADFGTRTTGGDGRMSARSWHGAAAANETYRTPRNRLRCDVTSW